MATPPVLLVADASFTIEAGRFVVINGPSGCGKSSLLYLLGLLDRPTAGTVLVEGEDMGPLNGDARARIRLTRFGFVFQFHFLLPELSAAENVALPMRRLGQNAPPVITARTSALLGSLGLADKISVPPTRLSGGERQRVAIARALANEPRLILADEPTGSLDSHNSDIVIETLVRLAHEGQRAVICVTHDPDIAARADQRIEMRDGRIVDVR
jgi:lipoprotein-releasing system ATP-binding protein